MSVQVIILCGTFHFEIFRSFMSEYLKGMTMILTPSWAPNIVLIEEYPEILNCSLSLEPESAVTAEFKHYIDDFYPLKYPKDLLLQNMWMMIFHCLSENTKKNKWYEKLYNISLHNCTGLERMRNTWNHLSQEMYDPVYNAVTLLAKALNLIGLSVLDWDKNPASYRYKLVRYLKLLKYQGHSAINKYGEMTTNYVIHNNIIVNGTMNKIKVGTFLPYTSDKYRLLINESLINWKTPNNEIPKSRYSENCERCADHEMPNKNRTQCVLKLTEFLSYSDGISIIVLLGSMLLLTLTAVVLGIFIRYEDTPIVRANNKNLSFVLLVSIMLSFLSVFLFLGRPVDTTCRIRQISTGILLSISISSLLAKTIMVYMAFRATKPGSVWSRWSGVTLPNCVLLICSSVQGVICMSWVTLSPPFQEMDTHSYKEKMVVQCNEGSDLWFYSVLGYMGILAAVSFITAFLARTLPDSFNEAKYITFSMLVFCSVWIAMIPAYLSTKGKDTVAVEIFAILTSNAGLLGCIFFPKCYILLFKPELNTRKHLLGTKNTM
ncbi:vomeronasal type-2 receptor 26-like [Dendropsophus ebraccatus]|uniref:vomeronasal type-2 receptor 26-like n=1 Tax=Dendropsophus ebraccatus TaxID=150705 RepID=UPI0038321ED6